ncbi:MAG: L-lysine 6-transaminase [Vicinamibacteria bacterium]|nr:L-lysine 6-transaminase [Vicinamibacteria bacterium]
MGFDNHNRNDRSLRHPSGWFSIDPGAVRSVVGRLALTDGFEQVFDHDRSHGSWLVDARTGREYLDFFTFFASSPVGYNHPKLHDSTFQETLRRVARIKPSLSDFHAPEYAHFVETFRRLAVPSYFKHAFFLEGGALGVENALKTAMDWKVRRNRASGAGAALGSRIVHLREAFHGRTGYTLSLTNTDPVKTDGFPKFDWPRIDNPKQRFPVTPENEIGTKAAERRAIEQIERAFAELAPDIAAVIVEPIQGEGGDNHFRGEFLRAVEQKCRENDCFFIVDEVQTGVGLTGRFWAHEHFGLRPDALAFGKKAQIAGCLVGPRVDEEPENVFRVPSRLGSTFGGNLTDMVRFTRYLEIIDEDLLVDNARVVGERLLAGLREIERDTGGLMSNARGRGLMVAFDLPSAELRAKTQAALVRNGLLAVGCGVCSIRFRPPLNLSAAEADHGLEIVRTSLKQLLGVSDDRTRSAGQDL